MLPLTPSGWSVFVTEKFRKIVRSSTKTKNYGSTPPWRFKTMRFLDIQKMALHALGKNKIQTALTMLGIVIGVSAVIAMVSLGQGAQKLVSDQVAGMGTNVLQVQG